MPRPGGIQRLFLPSAEVGKHLRRCLLCPQPAAAALELMDAGGGSGGAQRTRGSDPQPGLLPFIRPAPLSATGPARFPACSGDSEPRDASLCRSPGSVSPLGGQRGSNRSWKSSKSRIFSCSCACRSPASLPQPLCLQTVSILCRASKNDVLNTARAEALNQINSFLILQAFESSALLEDC